MFITFTKETWQKILHVGNITKIHNIIVVERLVNFVMDNYTMDEILQIIEEEEEMAIYEPLSSFLGEEINTKDQNEEINKRRWFE